MSTAPAKVAIRVSCKLRLHCCYRLYLYLRIAQQVVKSAAQHRIPTAIDYCGRFNITGSRNTPGGSVLNGIGKEHRIGLITKDCNQR